MEVKLSKLNKKLGDVLNFYNAFSDYSHIKQYFWPIELKTTSHLSADMPFTPHSARRKRDVETLMGKANKKTKRQVEAAEALVSKAKKKKTKSAVAAAV